jgi:hypothetical protein
MKKKTSDHYTQSPTAYRRFCPMVMMGFIRREKIGQMSQQTSSLQYKNNNTTEALTPFSN